jgi:hypothetical protein
MEWQMQKVVFDLVGGIPTPEMTRAYEAQHAKPNWLDELARHLEETAPPVRAVMPPGYHFHDNSMDLGEDFLTRLQQEIQGIVGGEVNVRWMAFDEEGNLVDEN